MGVGGFDLAFDLIAREQRYVVDIQLEPALGVVGHEALHVFQALLECALVIDQDLADVVGQVVAQRARDRIAFLVDQERCAASLAGFRDRLPLGLEVIQVPLQLFGRATDAGGTHDGPHAVRHVELVHDLAHLVAVFALDAARYAAGARVIGHQYQETARQADESRERGALVAALLLLHLHQQLLALGDQLADVEPALRLGAKVLAGDFLQRQEAVPLCAVVDERRFERGLDARNAGLIDIGFFLFP